MGHLGHVKESYRKLFEKLDSYPIGIADHEKVHTFLRKLYSEKEADMISRMPLKPSSLEDLKKIMDINIDDLRKKMEEMSDRGIVFSAHQEGKEYYLPMWSIPGFVEMTLMKVREDISQKDFAFLMTEMFQEKEIAQDIFQGKTQFGRALLDQNTAQDTSEVLPHEIAAEAVKNAEKIAVSTCYCRHKKEHMGTPCKYPAEVCMAMDMGAEFMVRYGYGREISKKEALEILEETSKLGLMHIGDNVKNKLSFICNCCKCCCGILGAYHDHGIFPVAMSTSFTMKVQENCVGCGACVKKCPLDAIEIKNKKAVIDERICLGCGVCYRFCKPKALKLVKHEKKIVTPENSMEKILIMAIERGSFKTLCLMMCIQKSIKYLGKL